MYDAIRRHCPDCRDEREFETPPCPDDHGVDCPELVCTGCGTALVLAAPPRPAAVVVTVSAAA